MSTYWTMFDNKTRLSYIEPNTQHAESVGQQDIVRSSSKFESTSTTPKFKLISFVETADTWKLALIIDHKT